MISGADFYNVMTSMVPLYVAMIVAYASVKWWRIFTPDQCSGINRFVAAFAVPLLSFHFISSNDPYKMNLRFIAADTVQKLFVLGVLAVWANLSKGGSIEWTITLFSVSTLPNTLVMGIPLLTGMYGDFSASLMVQIVVLQCIIWYTVLLFMLEYRGGKMLISAQFPDTAASIVSIQVDSDVMSLDGRQPLETQTEIKQDGKLRVTVRKSNADRSMGLSFNPSNLTNAEIYSLRSTPRVSSFNPADVHSMIGSARNSDVYGLRASNFEGESAGKSRYYHATVGSSHSNAHYPAPNSETSKQKAEGGGRDLHMFGWSSSASDVFGGEVRVAVSPRKVEGNQEDYLERDDLSFGNTGSGEGEEKKGKVMPPTSVMTRLVLIMVWRKLIRNPNTYSSLIGLIWSLVSSRWHVQMPAIIAKSISILSDAGLGMAMFSLGLFMALQPRMIVCGKSVAAYSMAVKFLVGPALMAAASAAVGLRGVLLRVAILQAVLPQAIVPFVFAKEYNVHADIHSTGVIFGMLVAVPITLVYYVLLEL